MHANTSACTYTWLPPQGRIKAPCTEQNTGSAARRLFSHHADGRHAAAVCSGSLLHPRRAAFLPPALPLSERGLASKPEKRPQTGKSFILQGLIYS